MTKKAKRHEKKNNVKQKEEKRAGYGNKKLEGPDRPSV